MPSPPRMDAYPLPLYSKVRRAIELAPMESAPITAWRGWLLAQSKNGISPHELSCLDFATAVGRVNKQGMLDHFQHLASDIEVLIHRKEKPRELQLQPVNMDGSSAVSIRLCKTIRKVIPFITHHNPVYDFNITRLSAKDLLGNEFWAVLDSNGKYWKCKYLRTDEKPYFQTQQEAMNWCRRVARHLIPNTYKVLEPFVRWEDVRLEGGESYTEWLITQPHHTLNQEFRPNAHFNVKNLILHLRTSIYPSAGKRILLIEELQSDYFQTKRRMAHIPVNNVVFNPFESSWVELGLRIATLIACRQGLDGIAITNGQMQDAIYQKVNEGRATFYESKVANALKKLAKPLGAEVSLTTVIARTQRFKITDAGPEYAGTSGRYSLHAIGSTIDHIDFDNADAAEALRGRLEKTITASVPVLWLNTEQKLSLKHFGLPVLGAVEKLNAH